MCGIAGVLHFGKVPDAQTRVAAMAESIVHRGPDDVGFWSDADISLGFRRLAIVDLDTGAQPMGNENGRVQVIFNGEIYNHRELRKELLAAGHTFRTDHSDTEVIVHGYEHWGEGLPARLNGMFAFAVWDQRKRELFIARDRLGIKPVYVGKSSQAVVFSSEIRALHRSGLIPTKPNAEGVFEYFQQQNLWEGRSMFSGVQMLEPGSWLRVGPERQRTEKFWEIHFDRRALSMPDAAGMLHDSIESSLKRQIAADVPVMAYLSGGIDSSSIVAGAHRLDPAIHAYSCIFDLGGVGDDRIVDEREYSRALAQSLDIPQVELELPADELQRTLFATIAALEEPRMGMAYVNYRIAERTSRDSKVVLSGCGGDEILAGYVGRYAALRDRFRASSPPTDLRSTIRSLFSPGASRSHRLLEAILPLCSYPLLPQDIKAAFTPEFRRAAGDYSVRDGVAALIAEAPSEDIWDILMYVDLKTYLHGLLVVEDKVSMAHGLETRVPLLDNEIVDLSLSYDLDLLTDGAVGKKVFREAIRTWVPAVIADKPKMGFAPPDASWYRGLLRPFIERVLDPVRIRKRGVFLPEFVSTAIEDHMAGRANRVSFLWSALSFEAWCEATGFYGGDLGMPVTRG